MEFLLKVRRRNSRAGESPSGSAPAPIEIARDEVWASQASTGSPTYGRFHSVSKISPVSETRTSRVLPSAAFLPRIS